MKTICTLDTGFFNNVEAEVVVTNAPRIKDEDDPMYGYYDLVNITVGGNTITVCGPELITAIENVMNVYNSDRVSYSNYVPTRRPRNGRY